MDFFDMIVRYDEVHFFSSLAVMSAGRFVLWKRAPHRRAASAYRLRTQITVMGLGLGTAWEIIEFDFLDVHLWDTVSDVFLDILGAGIGG